MTKVFIDGSSGTTGLRIRERLCTRKDIELIALDEAHRKDAGARRDAFQKADVAFLCLPDAAAVEAVELAADSGAVIIDTSTAHRTAAGWTYGMPELTGYKDKIAKVPDINADKKYLTIFNIRVIGNPNKSSKHHIELRRLY